MIGSEERAKESEGVTKCGKRDKPASSKRLKNPLHSPYHDRRSHGRTWPPRDGREREHCEQCEARRFEWAA